MVQVLSGGPGEIIDSAAHRWTAHRPQMPAFQNLWSEMVFAMTIRTAITGDRLLIGVDL
jgi:hypothetical protein